MSIFDKPIKITPEFLEAHGCASMHMGCGRYMNNVPDYEYISWHMSLMEFNKDYSPFGTDYLHRRIRVNYQFLPEHESCICLVVAEEWKSNFPECDPYIVAGDIPNISTVPLALEAVDNILDLEMIAEKMNDCEWSYLFTDKIHPYEK